MRPFHYISILFLLCMSAWGIAHFRVGASWWYPIVLSVLYVHSLVLGAIYIRWNFYVSSLHHSPAAGNKIALTFDDGPAEQTAAILDILHQQQVPAAFFSIGKNAARYPQLVQRWDAEGHLVGNHSYAHGFNFDWKSTGAMREEIVQTNQEIKRLIGKSPRLFRPPYGVTNPNLAKAIRTTGMVSIGWNIRSFDTTAKDPQQLLQRILGKLQGGDVILLHDSMEITHQILTELIHQARQKGFTFVRLDQLLQIDAYA